MVVVLHFFSAFLFFFLLLVGCCVVQHKSIDPVVVLMILKSKLAGPVFLFFYTRAEPPSIYSCPNNSSSGWGPLFYNDIIMSTGGWGIKVGLLKRDSQKKGEEGPNTH